MPNDSNPPPEAGLVRVAWNLSGLEQIFVLDALASAEIFAVAENNRCGRMGRTIVTREDQALKAREIVIAAREEFAKRRRRSGRRFGYAHFAVLVIGTVLAVGAICANDVTTAIVVIGLLALVFLPPVVFSDDSTNEA